MPSARKGPARGARGADAPDTVAAPVNIKAQVVEGVAWKIAAQIVSALSRLVVGVILARLLTRDAFGVAGMALVIAAFVSIFADLNLGSALIQRDLDIKIALSRRETKLSSFSRDDGAQN